LGRTIEDLGALEIRVSEAIQQFDSMQAARAAVFRSQIACRSLVLRSEAARKRLEEAQEKLAEARAAEADASAALCSDNATVSQVAPSPARTMQQSLNSAVAKLNRSEVLMGKLRHLYELHSEEFGQLAAAVQTAKREEEQALTALQKERTDLLHKINRIISSQQSINRRLHQ
ncbi:MAG: hypothetical protein SNJ52_02460, partial [Verrucomicrobiia bacterium]